MSVKKLSVELLSFMSICCQNLARLQGNAMPKISMNQTHFVQLSIKLFSWQLSNYLAHHLQTYQHIDGKFIVCRTTESFKRGKDHQLLIFVFLMAFGGSD